MTYQIIPLTEAPAQSVQVTLGNQVCAISVYTKSLQVPSVPPGSLVTDPPVYARVNPVFLDLYVNDALIVAGVICLHANRLVRDAYLGFIGDLAFYDLQGTADPAGRPPAGATASEPAEDGSGSIPGLGSRFVLTYWAPA